MAPSQWLWELESTPDAYAALLDQTGSLALAAYRLARAQCRTRSVPTDIPTRIELGVAASLIAQRTGWPEPVPPSSILALDCDEAGLLVL